MNACERIMAAKDFPQPRQKVPRLGGPLRGAVFTSPHRVARPLRFADSAHLEDSVRDTNVTREVGQPL